MSIKVMNAVWNYGPSDSTRRFVLLAIADNASDDGGNAYPSVAELARKCALSERTVIRALESLIDDGYLIRRRRRNTSNIYQVVLGALVSDTVSLSEVTECHPVSDKLSSPEVTQCHPGSDTVSLRKVTNCHVGGDTVSHDPSLNHPINHQGEPARATEPQPAAVSPPPPVVVRSVIPDRTPGGMGYELSDEPPVDREPRHKPPPSPEAAAIGEMANALTDVTGVASRLNWGKVGPVAGSLVEDGYTPEQVRRHFGRVDPGPGAWWYWRDDWRGKTTEKRKGEPPSLAVILERIGLATLAGAQAAATPQERPLTINEKISLLLGQKPATAGAAGH